MELSNTLLEAEKSKKADCFLSDAGARSSPSKKEKEGLMERCVAGVMGLIRQRTGSCWSGCWIAGLLHGVRETKHSTT